MSIETRIKKRLLQEQGFYLLDILTTLVLFAFLALSLLSSTLFSLNTQIRTHRNSLAMQLAAETLEEYVAISPQLLSDANDTTETIVFQGLSFNRDIDVTVNADGSRTVDVSISGEDEVRGGVAALSSTFALWGTR